MNPLIRAIIVFFLITSPTWACAAESSGKPRASFPETKFEFKPTVEGKTITHDFVVQNKGSAELIIKNIITT